MERAKIATQTWSEIVQTEKKRKDMRKRINKPRYQIQPARGDPKMVKIICENIRKKESIVKILNLLYHAFMYSLLIH